MASSVTAPEYQGERCCILFPVLDFKQSHISVYWVEEIRTEIQPGYSPNITILVALFIRMLSSFDYQFSKFTTGPS